MPAVTLKAGILPSTLTLIGVWIYMVASGFLVAEINIRMMERFGRPEVGLLTATQCCLGKGWALGASVLYVFLHYAMLVAYLSRGGEILTAAIAQAIRFPTTPPQWLGASSFACLLGSSLYFGSERFVGRLNSILTAGVVASFCGILTLALLDSAPGQPLYQNWTAASTAIPVMLVALVYHNVVPVVSTQLEGDGCKIRQAILVGSAIPLLMFLAWNATILSSVHLIGSGNFTEIPFDPLEWLQNGSANRWLSTTISIFSELAIATSFVGFFYGLLNFFSEAFAIALPNPPKRSGIYALALLPPIVLAAFIPNLFLTALDYAGTFGISVLFGILPAAIVWKQRDRDPAPETNRRSWLPGGKIALIVTIGIAAAVISEQLLTKTGLL